MAASAAPNHRRTTARARSPDDVVVALRSLSDRQREALVLHHMGDFAVADVAQVMGIGVPAVKTHLQRGRASLARLLGDEGGER